jgi:hypothetical protein
MKCKIDKFLLVAILTMTAATVNAAPVRYANSGVENPDTYSFTASTTGDLIAYFAGSSASFTNTLGLIVNGIEVGLTGLNNKLSSYGDSINFGHVNAGDSLVFKLNVLTTGKSFFSDKTLNNDNVNHVFSNSFLGDSSIPAGTYVAFEDLNGGGNFNYHDENFVFTNVAVSPVPVPAGIWLFGTGLMSLASFVRRKSA